MGQDGAGGHNDGAEPAAASLLRRRGGAGLCWRGARLWGTSVA
jgi:hypothetical protein